MTNKIKILSDVDISKTLQAERSRSLKIEVMSPFDYAQGDDVKN